MKQIRLAAVLAVVFLAAGTLLFGPAPALAVSCPLYSTGAGMVTMTANVPAAGTYAVWIRLLAPDSDNNSVNVQIDNNCWTMGDSSSIATGSLTWVNYQNGNTGSLVSVPLTAGSHAITFAGREAGVGLDLMLLIADGCTPQGTGSNCTAVPPTPTPAHTADLNNDGHVNVFDLSALLSKWGTAGGTADINKNGTVDVFDLSTLLSQWTG